MYVVLGKPACPGCESIKKYLTEHGAAFTYVDITAEGNESWFTFVTQTLGVRSVPQVLKVSSVDEVMNEL